MRRRTCKEQEQEQEQEQEEEQEQGEVEEEEGQQQQQQQKSRSPGDLKKFQKSSGPKSIHKNATNPGVRTSSLCVSCLMPKVSTTIRNAGLK